MLMFNYCFFAGARKGNRLFFMGGGALAVFVLVCGAVPSQKTESGYIDIALCQGNIDQLKKWDSVFRDSIMETYLRLSDKAADRRPDMIVWPETSIPGDYLHDPGIKEYVDSIVSRTRIPLLAGGPLKENGRFYNAALFITPSRGELVYRKNKIVPFGEGLPLNRAYSWLRDRLKIETGIFSPSSETGIFSFQQDERAPVRFGVMICSEDFYDGIAGKLVDSGAEFMINIINSALLGETAAGYTHLAASVIRAVENDRAVVRAANSGISCFISPEGRIAGVIRGPEGRIATEGISSGRVSLKKGRTFYRTTGKYFPLLCGGLVLLSCVKRKY
jgi:apolipoprotein N-acyltransferase